MHFFSKKNFKTAPTPNRSTDHHENLVEAKYRFFLLPFQIWSKSVHLKRRYGFLKSGYVFQKNAIFDFWQKKLKKSILDPQIFFGYYFDHLTPTEKNGSKKYSVLLPLWLKNQKFGYQNLHQIFKKSQFCKNSLIFDASSRNQSSIGIFTWPQSFKMVQNQKNTKKLFKV